MAYPSTYYSQDGAKPLSWNIISVNRVADDAPSLAQIQQQLVIGDLPQEEFNDLILEAEQLLAEWTGEFYQETQIHGYYPANNLLEFPQRYIKTLTDISYQVEGSDDYSKTIPATDYVFEKYADIPYVRITKMPDDIDRTRATPIRMNYLAHVIIEGATQMPNVIKAYKLAVDNLYFGRGMPKLAYSVLCTLLTRYRRTVE